jgi:hypothetical protein
VPCQPELWGELANRWNISVRIASTSGRLVPVPPASASRLLDEQHPSEPAEKKEKRLTGDHPARVRELLAKSNHEQLEELILLALGLSDSLSDFGEFHDGDVETTSQRVFVHRRGREQRVGDDAHDSRG